MRIVKTNPQGCHIIIPNANGSIVLHKLCSSLSVSPEWIGVWTDFSFLGVKCKPTNCQRCASGNFVYYCQFAMVYNKVSIGSVISAISLHIYIDYYSILLFQKQMYLDSKIKGYP